MLVNIVSFILSKGQLWTSKDVQPEQCERKERTGWRSVPRAIYASTFDKIVEKDKRIPGKRYHVCCRLFYSEEYNRMWEIHREEVEKRFIDDRNAALAGGANH